MAAARRQADHRARRREIGEDHLARETEHPARHPGKADYAGRPGYARRGLAAGFSRMAGRGLGLGLGEPAFYAYAYPEPAGFRDWAVEPAAAYYHTDLHEYVLPYEAVRNHDDPDTALLSFLRTTYEAAAEKGGWDRESLER